MAKEKDDPAPSGTTIQLPTSFPQWAWMLVLMGGAGAFGAGGGLVGAQQVQQHSHPEIDAQLVRVESKLDKLNQSVTELTIELARSSRGGPP